MKNSNQPLDEIKGKIKIEQTVREFLNILEKNELEYNEGLIAWNMLGFTIFQNLYPNEDHEKTQNRMIEFSKKLFDSRKIG